MTEKELLALISKAAREGKSLTDLISGRDSDAPRPPVVVIGRPTLPKDPDSIYIRSGVTFDADALREEVLSALEEREQAQLRKALACKLSNDLYQDSEAIHDALEERKE